MLSGPQILRLIQMKKPLKQIPLSKYPGVAAECHLDLS